MKNSKNKVYKIKKVTKHKNSKNSSLSAVLAILLTIESLSLALFVSHVSRMKYEHINTVNSIKMSATLDDNTVYSRLINALSNNKHLKEEEKNLIIEYLPTFIKNKEYIDIDYIEDRLLNLKIIYKKNDSKKVITKKGLYLSNKCEITFYDVNNISEVDIAVFTHELFHVMQKTYFNGYNDFLVETTNTIFNEDSTNRREKTLYSNYYNFTKMLIEIVGIEPFNKYQGYSMEEPIIEALVNIFGTESDAKKLLGLLAEYKMQFDKMVDNDSASDSKLKKLNKVREDIITRLGIYYESKNGFSMDNDLIMLYYYDYAKFRSILSNKFFVDEENVKIYETNNVSYFGDKKDTNIVIYARGPVKRTQIVIDFNGRVMTKNSIIDDYEIIYTIDDDNRYINKQQTLKKNN